MINTQVGSSENAVIVSTAGQPTILCETQPAVTVLVAPAAQGPSGPAGESGFGGTLEILTDTFNQPIGHIAA